MDPLRLVSSAEKTICMASIRTRRVLVPQVSANTLRGVRRQPIALLRRYTLPMNLRMPAGMSYRVGSFPSVFSGSIRSRPQGGKAASEVNQIDSLRAAALQ